jgi:hypothetical protein
LDEFSDIKQLFYRHNIQVIDIDENAKEFMTYEYITHTKNICKTIIPYIMYDNMEYDDILLLDLDIEIKRDICNIYNYDLDKDVCGCIDVYNNTCIRRLNYMFNNLNLHYNTEPTYINSGVLVYHMNNIRNNYDKEYLKNIMDMFIYIRSKCNDDDVWCRDQHIINIIYKNKGILPIEYNCTLKDKHKNIINNAFIIHYLGGDIIKLIKKIT